jgi:hypothetical protein
VGRSQQFMPHGDATRMIRLYDPYMAHATWRNAMANIKSTTLQKLNSDFHQKSHYFRYLASISSAIVFPPKSLLTLIVCSNITPRSHRCLPPFSLLNIMTVRRLLIHMPRRSHCTFILFLGTMNLAQLRGSALNLAEKSCVVWCGFGHEWRGRWWRNDRVTRWWWHLYRRDASV